MTMPSLLLGLLLIGSPQSPDTAASLRDPAHPTNASTPTVRSRGGAEDIARVAAFLVTPPDSAGEIEVLSGRARPVPSTLQQFRAFTENCEIREITVMTGRSASDQAPVMARWVCPVPQSDRTAAFWLDESGIVRLAFGIPERVALPHIPTPGTP